MNAAGDDFEIKIRNVNSLEGINEYIEIIKIKSRYEFHKNISFDLVQKRKEYSDSQLNEIERIFVENDIYFNKENFKKQVFGSVIFEDESTNRPFAKYQQDIAKQLGLIP